MVTENPCGLPEERFASVAANAVGRTTVGHLLEWGRENPALFSNLGVLSDVVVQDEFTHDVVVNLSNDLVLVYDST
jgi:hypothetical protein